LVQALFKKNYSAMELLIEHGADINEADEVNTERERTPHHISNPCCYLCPTMLLAANHSIFFSVTHPLYLSVYLSIYLSISEYPIYLHLIHLSLTHISYIYVSIFIWKFQRSVLYNATNLGNYEAMEILIKHNANVDMKDKVCH
jgi:ankyrin repeat protein